MRRLLMAAALSTSCLAVSACSPKRVVTNLAPPPARLVCEAAGPRPTIAPEYVVDWTRVATVTQARDEHRRFVASIRTREGAIAGYILSVEGRLFACASNARWLRDWYAETAR